MAAKSLVIYDDLINENNEKFENLNVDKLKMKAETLLVKETQI